MSLQLLCLICDEGVEPGRQGNLVTGDGVLRERLEKVVGSGVEGSPRCVSLCETCEGSVGTIEDYYRHVENFRTTFASTLAKYGETLLASQPNKSEEVESEPPQDLVRYEGEDGGGGGEVGGQDAVSGATWTICLQAEDGSLVPIQQGGPLVMADDQQVVLETVTVESSESQQQVVEQEEEPQSGGHHGDYVEAEGSADNMMLHPSIMDHTGMALTNQTNTEGNNEEAENEAPPKPLFTCARCGAQFEEAEDLVTHERNEGHLGGYNYKCGVCGNIYARLDSLRDHMCRHTGHKPHQCSLCGDSFSFRNQLSRHRSSHYQTQASYTAADQHKPAAQGYIAAAAEGKDGEGMAAELDAGAETEAGEEAAGAGKALVLNEDISSQLQSMLNSSELQLVQMNSGELQLVSKQFENGETNLACPKCSETFATRFLLQRHQCPSLSQNAVCQFECPKCSASFIKRSFLERHRCPSLFYPLQKPDDIIPEPAEMPTDANEDSTPPNQNENESLLTISNNETLVTANFDDTAISDQVAPTADVAQNQDTAQSTADSVEITLKTNNESPYIYETSEISNKSTTDAQETEDVNDVVEAVGEPLKVEEGTGAETPSTGFRRSIRAAGKVNPILEMLKKKSGTKVDKTDNEQSGGMVTKTKDITEAHKDTSEHDEVGVNTPGSIEGLVSCVKRKRGRPRKIQPQDSPSTPTAAATEAISGEPATPEHITSAPATPKPVKREHSVTEPITSEPDSPEADTPTPKRGRGRPPKKRGPGRPRKYSLPKLEAGVDTSHQSQEGENETDSADIGNVVIVKRKRGRPRKSTVSLERDESLREGNETDVSREEPQESPPRKKRGRPRKVPTIEYKAESDTEDKVLEETPEKKNTENGRSKRTIKKRVLLDHVEDGSDSDKELEEDKKEQEVTETEATLDPTQETNKEEDDEENYVPMPKKQQGMRRDFQKVRTEYKCEKCDRFFSTLVALEKHKETLIHKHGRNTPETRKFKCNVCGRGFTKLENLRDHGVNHSSEMRYQCVVCAKKFKFRSQLALHRNRVHSTGAVSEAMRKHPQRRTKERYKNSHLPPGDEQDDPKYQPEVVAVDGVEDGEADGKLYRCKNCLQIFTEMRLFNRHIISHYSVKPFKCDICSKEFARADTLRTHTKVHYFNFEQTDNKVFLCDTCGRQFTKVESLRNHVKMHFGERAWTCEECGKGFIDKYTLSRHVVIHKTEKPWLCATCGRGFNRRSHLEAHEAQHTGKTLYKCEICDRGFSDQGNLGRHMLVHSDARPWACSVCGDTFKRKGNLDEHELTHNTERGAVCDVCGARFTTKRYLRIHQLIHSGDRPHQCSVCNAAFRQLSALITHKRIHTGDAPYKCQHCEKRFKYYDQWKAHEYSHMDAKPYKCMLCSATYRQAGSLRQHRKVVHGNQKGMLFLCTVCNKTFASTMSLERHMKKVHGAEASLQSLQAIGQEVMTGANETSNIVQITNPQGTIETIELTNLPSDGSTNIVQLLSGQTLGSLQANQVGVGGQFTHGHRLVQLVGGLDTAPQVVQVSAPGGAGAGGGGGGEVISIDSMGNITNSAVTASPTVVSEPDGALQYDPGTQQTLVHITNGQPVFVDATGAEIDQAGNHHAADNMRDALPHQVSHRVTKEEEAVGEEGRVQEVQTLSMDADTNRLSVVSITPQQLAHINTAAGEHQVISTPSLVPLGIEVVPIDTTVTTQHHQLVTMETTQEATETMQQLDVQAADVIQVESDVMHVESDVIHQEGDVIHAGNDIIHVGGDVIHTGSVQSDVVYEGSDVIYTGNDIIHVGSDVIHVGSDVMHDSGDIITETVTHELTDQEVVETVSIATSYDHVPGM